MHQHPWPGNVRELYNTLSRAAIWTPNETIEADDIRGALFPITISKRGKEEVLNRSLGNGFSLPVIMAAVAHHYLKRAFAEAQGNKTMMASLLGLPSYQTLSNWLKKYKIDS
jgi:DNA-binding NtrC family response regulator